MRSYFVRMFWSSNDWFCYRIVDWAISNWRSDKNKETMYKTLNLWSTVGCYLCDFTMFFVLFFRNTETNCSNSMRESFIAIFHPIFFSCIIHFNWTFSVRPFICYVNEKFHSSARSHVNWYTFKIIQQPICINLLHFRCLRFWILINSHQTYRVDYCVYIVAMNKSVKFPIRFNANE